jgi:poly-gamma-glutamate synthesis protein (capsule biosynthesis protein)
LETVFAGEEYDYTGYPIFNSPDELMEGLKFAGFNLLYTANNHSYDKGKNGLKRTITLANKFGIETIGTNLSKEDSDSVRVKNIKGIKAALLAYSYSTNGIELPEGESYLVSQIDTTQIRQDIEKARNKDAELVIVYFHFGTEYKTTPSLYQREVVNKAISNGADIIIGSPHVLQPVKKFTSEKSNIDTGFVAYSLGNFVSNQRWRYSDGGVLLSFSVEKDLTDRSIHLKNLEYLPFWVFKGIIEGDRRYLVLPEDEKVIQKYKQYFTSEDIHNMNQFFADTDSIITSHVNIPKADTQTAIPKFIE